jgi:hypothetical protein
VVSAVVTTEAEIGIDTVETGIEDELKNNIQKSPSRFILRGIFYFIN